MTEAEKVIIRQEKEEQLAIARQKRAQSQEG